MFARNDNCGPCIPRQQRQARRKGRGRPSSGGGEQKGRSTSHDEAHAIDALVAHSDRSPARTHSGPLPP